MSDVSLHSVTPADRSGILHVLQDAFRREDEARLVEKLWLDNAVTIELIAKEKTDIVGYCAFSPVTAEPHLDGALLGLAPLAVLNDRQGKGIGKALAMAGLEQCRTSNTDLVVLLGEPDYYARFGFKPAADYNLKWAAMDAGAAFQAINLGNIAIDTPHLIHYHKAFSEV